MYPALQYRYRKGYNMRLIRYSYIQGGFFLLVCPKNDLVSDYM